MEAKGSMRLFVKKNSLKLVFLSSCIDRGHGWAATAIFACATQWLHADIPKRGLSNDEKADFKGNCIRFIGASIRVCEKKFPETGFSFILIWSKAMFQYCSAYFLHSAITDWIYSFRKIIQYLCLRFSWKPGLKKIQACRDSSSVGVCGSEDAALNRRLTQIERIARISQSA